MEGSYIEACREIGRRILSGEVKEPRQLSRVKVEVCRDYRLDRIPSNPDILRYSDQRDKLVRLLRLKPVRSISGIVILSVMTAPTPCPHGRCIYCPWLPGAPISYTGKEPAARRGIQNAFNPALQIRQRLRQLEEMGHDTQKIELIIQGGTFNATPPDYREEYMKGVLEGILGHPIEDYGEGLREAEKSRYRLVGMALETRPDQVGEEEIDWILSKAFTRVEIGVQTIYDDIYDRVKRGHHLKDVIDATRRLKDAGLKVGYHLMPGLPGVTPTLDLQAIYTVFEDEDMRPDQLKLYPTLVLDGTELHQLWRDGGYEPLSSQEAIPLIGAAKANLIPPWVRIMRVQRDIPSDEVVAGVKHTNLREMVGRSLEVQGLRCPCIRCREAGHRRLKDGSETPIGDEIRVEIYPASRGVEFFLSMESLDGRVIAGFLRLRKPSDKAWREEVTSAESFIIRELHVFGTALPLGLRSEESWQHRGVGEGLLKEAEESAERYGGEKILVLSGVGAKEYYYKHGYIRDGPYLSKRLR